MGESGQASVEYAGLVGLVVCVLAVPVFAGRDLTAVVVREVRRALCVVTGGECEVDRRPCVVGARQVEDDGAVDLAVVKIGSRELVLREARSDGTVAVTFVRDRRAGLALGAGVGGHLRIGRRRLGVGVEAQATVLAALGGGTTWVLHDARAADRLMRRLIVDGARALGRRVVPGGRPDATGAPAPASTSSQRALAVTLGGAAGPALLGADLTLSSEDVAGATTERATGRRTFVVRRRNGLVGSVTRAGRLAGGLDETYTVTVDRGGQPRDLGVVRGGDLQGGGRWEAETHLDLSHEGNAAVARDFLREVVAPRPRVGRVVPVSAALRRRLESDGVRDERTYALRSDARGLGLGGGSGLIRLGGEYERRQRRLRLVRARQRGPDGLWRTRTDCLPPAA